MDFAERYGPWALVTGAAAGVGLAFAEDLAARGLGVVLVDRDPRVAEVADGVAGPTRFCVVDVAQPGWTDELAATCRGLEIGLAVANAGRADTGWFLDLAAQDRTAAIDVNCRAVTELAAWSLPAMVERGHGGFVATSSGSALAGTAGVALYSATKAFVVNLVEAIGWELRDAGIDTLAIVAPTMTTPGFLAGDADPDAMVVDPVDPLSVVHRGLDVLGVGGRWLADEGLEFIATVPRRDRVEMMSAATVAMYRHRLGG